MLEYGKSGIYNSNRLPAEKEEKEKKEKEKIPGIGRYPMGPTKIAFPALLIKSGKMPQLLLSLALI